VVVTLDKINDAKHLAEKIIDLITDNTLKAGVPVTVSAGICGSHKNHADNCINQHEVVENLINSASLASTKAKTLNQKYIIA
jgi:GGDEF domain-containing protein